MNARRLRSVDEDRTASGEGGSSLHVIVTGRAAVVDRRPLDHSTSFRAPVVVFFLALSVRGGEQRRYHESDDRICEWSTAGHEGKAGDCGVGACARVLAL